MIIRSNEVDRSRAKIETTGRVLETMLSSMGAEIHFISSHLEHFRDGMDVKKSFMDLGRSGNAVMHSIKELENQLTEYYQKMAELITERQQDFDEQRSTSAFDPQASSLDQGADNKLT